MKLEAVEPALVMLAADAVAVTGEDKQRAGRRDVTGVFADGQDERVAGRLEDQRDRPAAGRAGVVTEQGRGERAERLAVVRQLPRGPQRGYDHQCQDGDRG